MSQRLVTAVISRRPPFSSPPTKPPTSLISSFCDFGIALYSANVSCVRWKERRRSSSCDQRISCDCHRVDLRLVPTEMRIRPSCLTRGPLSGIALALIGASHPFPNKRSQLFVVAVPESLQLLFDLRDKPMPSMLNPHSPSDKDK